MNVRRTILSSLENWHKPRCPHPYPPEGKGPSFVLSCNVNLFGRVIRAVPFRPSSLECMHKEKKGRKDDRGGVEDVKKAGGKWSLSKSPNTFPASPRVNERTNERDRISEQPHLQPRHRKQQTNCRFDSSADLPYFISFRTGCMV